MFFSAPDFWGKLKHMSVLSFSWKVIVLMFIFSTSFYGILFAEEGALLEFSDNNSRGGLLTGDLIITVPENISSDKISEFALHWGINPHQRLGMFRPIVVLPSVQSGNRMRIQFKATRVPPGATHFLLYARLENGEEKEKYSLILVDKGVPQSKPQRISFKQTGKEGNRVQGEISIRRAWDEREVSQYAVYWGKGSKSVLRTQPSVTVIEKKSWFGNLAAQLQAPWKENTLTEEIDVLLPPEATHLIVFSRNEDGQMSEGTSFELEKTKTKGNSVSKKMKLQKKSAPDGMIIGNVTLFRGKDEIDSGHYLFFWGKNKKTRLENLPPITTFEVNKIKDGLNVKEIQVSSLKLMDQKLQVSSGKQTNRELKFEFPPETFIPKGATHILAFTQQKFWFQDDAVRRLKGPVASVSLKDPDGIMYKEKNKSNIKKGLKNFSIAKFKKKGLKSQEKKENDTKIFREENTNGTGIRKAPEWRISENRGLGIGLSLSGLNGIATFYDYNLEDNRQLHYSLELTGQQVGSPFKVLRLTEESTDMQSISKSGSGNSLEIDRTLVYATYRWFVDESIVWGISEGLFYGAGGGFGYATLEYQGKDTNVVATITGDSEAFDSTATDYYHSANALGLFAVLETGWQGLENYYFQIALQPSIYFYYNDNFEESSIPVDPNQRSTVVDLWTRAKNLTRLLLAFGIFF